MCRCNFGKGISQYYSDTSKELTGDEKGDEISQNVAIKKQFLEYESVSRRKRLDC